MKPASTRDTFVGVASTSKKYKRLCDQRIFSSDSETESSFDDDTSNDTSDKESKPPSTPSKKLTKIIVENDKVVKELCNIIMLLSQEAIKQNGCFNMGLSGGSVAKYVCEALPLLDTDWSEWKLFFCDERLVPVDDKESTLRLYIDGLIGTTPLKRDQLVAVDTSLDVNSAAEDYESKLRGTFPESEWPVFDLLLLGMGPDGHTASLFPEHPLLEESELWIAPISDSPKPPPERVTMTLPVINNAKACAFTVTGEGKASMVKRIIGHREDLPCTRVQPKGELFWIMDKAAASQL